MANSDLTVSVKVQYPDLDDTSEVPAQLFPHPLVTRAPHTLQSMGQEIVTAGASAGDAFPLDLGDIATEVTGFTLKNNSGQDLEVSINSSAEAAAAFATTYAAQFAILDAFTGTDPAADIVAAIATAKAALDAALADVTAGAWSMPNGAVLSYATPIGADTPIVTLAVVATDTQSDDGTVDYQAAGDPE